MVKNITKEKRKVGIIEPVGKLPPEAVQLYGDKVQFVVANANVKSLTPEGYESAIKNLPSSIDKLVQADVEAISIMGTSLTFFKGREYNEKLKELVAQQSGLPTTTMTSAIIDGLKKLSAKNIAVVTAYSSHVTELLANVLKEYGINPLTLEYLNIEISDLENINSSKLVEAGCKAVENTDCADALLISCGGLLTIDAINLLEDKLGIPVVSSSVAGAWASVQLVGLSGYASNAGKLLRL